MAYKSKYMQERETEQGQSQRQGPDPAAGYQSEFMRSGRHVGVQPVNPIVRRAQTDAQRAVQRAEDDARKEFERLQALASAHLRAETPDRMTDSGSEERLRSASGLIFGSAQAAPLERHLARQARVNGGWTDAQLRDESYEAALEAAIPERQVTARQRREGALASETEADRERAAAQERLDAYRQAQTALERRSRARDYAVDQGDTVFTEAELADDGYGEKLRTEYQEQITSLTALAQSPDPVTAEMAGEALAVMQNRQKANDDRANAWEKQRSEYQQAQRRALFENAASADPDFYRYANMGGLTDVTGDWATEDEYNIRRRGDDTYQDYNEYRYSMALRELNELMGRQDSVGLAEQDPAAAIARDEEINQRIRDLRSIFLTEEERQVYNYYLNKYGEQSAGQYLQALERDLNAREQEANRREIARQASEDRFSGAIADVAASWGQGAAYGYLVYQKLENLITGQPNQPDINSRWFNAVQAEQANQEGLMEGLDWWGQTLLSAGLSSVQSLSRAYMLGPLSMAVMGSGAGGAAAYNALKDGATLDQAFALGSIAGFAEYITEEISVENLFENVRVGKFDTVQNMLYQLGKTVAIEGSQEMASDYINLAADIGIRGAESDFNKTYEAYLAQGYTEAEARDMTVNEYLVEGPLVSGLGGALSGLMGGGVSQLGGIVSTIERRGPGLNFIDLNRAAASEDVMADLRAQREELLEAYAQDFVAARQINKEYNDVLQAIIEETVAQGAEAQEENGTGAYAEEGQNGQRDVEGAVPYEEDGGARAPRATENENAASGTETAGTQFSLHQTTDGRTFVEVEEDILNGVPQKDWARTVKNNLRNKFKNGITVGNNVIEIDKQSRNEMTYSRYMRWLRRNDPGTYADKLRATNNSDEILEASTGWVDEGLNHPRNDKIRTFAAGNVLMSIGGRQYTARVVVGTEDDGSMKLYDILNLTPATFTEKETPAVIDENPSPGAIRNAADISGERITQTDSGVKGGEYGRSETEAAATAGEREGEAARQEGRGPLSDRNGRRGNDERVQQRAPRVREEVRLRGGSREQRAAVEQRTAAVEDQPLTSAHDQGIPNGTDRESCKAYPESDWDDEVRAAVEWAYAHGARNVIPVVGAFEVQDPRSGATVTPSGFLHEASRTVVLRVDYFGQSVSETIEHEIAHLLTTEKNLQAFIDDVKANLGEEAWRKIYDAYFRKYSTVTKGYVGMTEDEVQAYVWREILADAYAARNNYGVQASRLGQYADRALRDAAQAAERAGQSADFESRENAAATERTNGPGVYSFGEAHVPTYEELIAKDPIPVTDIRRTRNGSFAEERAAFLNSETARRMFAAPVVNRDTDTEVFIMPHTITHIFSNLGWEQIGLAEHLPEILENAVLTHAEASRNAPDDHTTGVFTLFGAVQTDEGVRPVKLKVKEYLLEGQPLPQNVADYLGTGLQPEAYAGAYDGKVLVLEGIEKEGPSSSASSRAETAPDRHPSGPSAISIEDLLALVKGDAARYIPQPSGQQYSVSDEDDLSRYRLTLPGIEEDSGQDNVRYSAADEEYMEAVEAGDVDQAQEMEEEDSLAAAQSASTQNDAEADMSRPERTWQEARNGVEDERARQIAALQEEIDRRSSSDYQHRLLDIGGVQAIQDNEKELKKLRQRLERLQAVTRVQDRMESRQKAKETKSRRAQRQEAIREAVRPSIAKANLRQTLMDQFSIPAGQRAVFGQLIDAYADRYLNNGRISQQDFDSLKNALYEAGVMTVEPMQEYSQVREMLREGRIYVNDTVRGEFGDDWNEFRKRAFAAGIYLTNSTENRGIDAWNAELAEELPGLFDADETDLRAALERIVQMAEEGKAEQVSLPEYTRMLAQQEYVSEDELLDNLERQLDWALRTFAEKAKLEMDLKAKSRTELAEERARHRESGRRQSERQQLRDLQQRTLKQLQWLSQNRNRAPADLRAAFDEVLSNIDIYAVSAANELNWSRKYNATWRDLVDMYKASRNPESDMYDPNLLENKEIEKIVARLELPKIADMDVGALQDLYKLAVGLRTELYNRNNLIGDAMNRMFQEVYEQSVEEIRAAGKGEQGVGSRIFNDAQLTPMNRLERMAGWNPNSTWYGMAKGLEEGERARRRFEVQANMLLAEFLRDNREWVKRADGQGKDAIWYEIPVQECTELRMGDKPIFGKTFTVYMTPAQKVQLYLESKGEDNLRHMLGGRTFVDKELYSKGKRTQALKAGTTVKLAPETVRELVKDLTPEERRLADVLEQFYNGFSKGEINRVSNILYGFDKAMESYYAPIYTNQNYTRSESGTFDITPEGVGNLKARVHSKNPSYNLSAFDAFEKSVDRTGKFVGLAIPVRNMETLLNWRGDDTSMKDVISHAWSSEEADWIQKLMQELQGVNEIKTNIIEQGVDKLLSKYISAVFGFNPSIVLKQAASFPLAAAYLGYGNAPNLVRAQQVDDKLIAAYTSELAYRLMGYATPETAALKNNPGKLQEPGALNFLFGGGAITWMDGKTVKTLWSWAENKVRKEQPNLQIGTEEQVQAGQSEFYKAVAREFEEATSRSQPMYDVMHRSEIMRNQSAIARTFTLFKTVPQQEYNMLRQTVGEARWYKEHGTAEQARDASRKAGRAVSGILIGNAMIGLITMLSALFRGKGKKYKDEEGNLALENVLGGFAVQYAKDAMGVALFGDTLADVLGAWITGEKFSGLEAPGIEQISAILEGIVEDGATVAGMVRESANVAAEGGDWLEYMHDHGDTYMDFAQKVATELAKYTKGLPVDNVIGYLTGPVSWLWPEAKVAYEDAISTANRSDLKGLTGAPLEMRVESILKDRTGSASEEAIRELAALYTVGQSQAVPPKVPTGFTVDGVEHELTISQQQTFKDVWAQALGDGIDELLQLATFREADDETRAKMLARLYDYATEQAKGVLLEDYEPKSEKAGTAIAEGASLAEWAAYATQAAALEGNEDYAFLREMEISDEAKRGILAGLTGTEETTDSGNASQYARTNTALESGLSMDEYLILREAGIDTEAGYTAAAAAKDQGVNVEAYATFREQVKEYDADGNGTITQAEAEEALESMISYKLTLPGGDRVTLTVVQAAVLWQLQNKGWSWEKNPFDKTVGKAVWEAMHEGE